MSGSNGKKLVPIRVKRIPMLNEPDNTLNRLNDMRLAGELCDAVFRVEGREFTVHRAVVSTCTSYFDDKFGTEADRHADVTGLQEAEKEEPVEMQGKKQIENESTTNDGQCSEDGSTSEFIQIDSNDPATNNNSNTNVDMSSVAVTQTDDDIIVDVDDSRDNQQDADSQLKPMQRKDLKVCRLPDEQADIMDVIINYAYCQELVVSSENVHRLLAAARRYNIRRLVEGCCSFMADNLNVSNCIGMKDFANKFYYDGLEKASLAFTLEHFGEVAEQSDELLALPVDKLVEILSAGNLNMTDELTAFNCVVRWINADREARKWNMNQLLRVVHLEIMRPEQLELVQSHDLVTDSAMCQTLIDESKQQRENNLVVNEKLVVRQNNDDMESCELLFVVGDENSRGASTAAIHTYDPRSHVWTQLSFGGLEPRGLRSCVAIGNYVYALSGLDDSCSVMRLHCYDTVTKQWTEKTPLHCDRLSLVVAALNGCVYVVGGWSGGVRLQYKIPESTAEYYDTATNKWKNVQRMHEPRSCAAAASLNGKLYVAGGLNGKQKVLHSVECYDPSANQWSFTRDMSTARSDHGLLAVGHFLYAVGGQDLRSAERFDPLTNTWSSIADMQHKRMHFAIGVVDDCIVVAGGTNAKSVEIYNTKTGTWELHASEFDIRCHTSGTCIIRSPPSINNVENKSPDKQQQQQQQQKQQAAALVFCTIL